MREDSFRFICISYRVIIFYDVTPRIYYFFRVLEQIMFRAKVSRKIERNESILDNREVNTQPLWQLFELRTRFPPLISKT